jgi:predicted dehydrogenase
MDSFEALLARKDVDAVVLAAPPGPRVEQAILAAQAGKAVYSEKPVSFTVEQGKQILEACTKAKVPFMVGQVLRYFGGYRRIAERIKRGDYGKIRALQVNRTSGPFPEGFRDPWRLRKEECGGLLLEVHVHEFDFSRHLCGNPLRVAGYSQRFGQDPHTDFEDFHVGTIEFEGGVLGEYHFSHISAAGETRFKVFLEKATVWAGFDGAWQQFWDKEVEVVPEPEGGDEPPYRREIRLFAEAVLNKQPVPIPGEEGLWAVLMAEAFAESAKLGRAIEISPDLTYR